jgi:outer membrane protein assembly factor BamD (BamD/ComL family)
VLGRAEGLLKNFPGSPDRAEALQLAGQAYAETDRPDLARAALERLRAEAPGSSAERELSERLRAEE